MRLWIFHHYASLPTKNGYIRPFRFAKHLEPKSICTTVFASSYHHWSGENVILDNSLFIVEQAENVPFVFVRTPSSESGTRARIINMLAYAYRLVKVTKKYGKQTENPDYIVASSPHPFTMLAGLWIARRHRVPCICEVRDLWPEAIFYNKKSLEHTIIGKCLTMVEHWIYKKADALIFTKEGDIDYLIEKKWLKEQGGNIERQKCYYINNGVEVSQYESGILQNYIEDADLEDETFKVIYAGAIRPVNNVRNIVEAAEILNKNSNVKFLIYGDGNEKESLEKLVKEKELKNIVFKGYVDKKYLPYILSKASVNLLNYSSEKYNWARGNSSNKLFEYMASGKPVIATMRTGYSIIEKYHCGIEMETQTPEGLAKAICEIQELPEEKYNEMCYNAKLGAKDFDYERLTERLYEVLSAMRNVK